MKERKGYVTEETRKSREIHLWGDRSDPVTDFVCGLEESIRKLKEPLSWQLPHNRRRSVRGMAVAREQREHQIRSRQEALNAIKKHNYEKIKFFKNENGKVVGFSVIR